MTCLYYMKVLLFIEGRILMKKIKKTERHSLENIQSTTSTSGVEIEDKEGYIKEQLYFTDIFDDAKFKKFCSLSKGDYFSILQSWSRVTAKRDSRISFIITASCSEESTAVASPSLL